LNLALRPRGYLYIYWRLCSTGGMGTTVQAILQEHYERYAATHSLAWYQQRAAEQLRDCRTAALGGHIVGCPNGHTATVHYNSCRHRSCPQCAALAREKWLAGWKARLLDAPHMHLTFTVAHQLVPLWRYNKRPFAELLFRAAAETLCELLADDKYLGALPGLLAALHTWGQQLQCHMHLHVLVTWGGLTADGRWAEPRKKCLLPRAVLMHKFRGKLCAFLRRALKRGRLVVPPDTTATQVQNLVNRLEWVDWHVKVPKEPYGHGRGVVTYWARYLKGGPLSNGRLVDCRNGMVRFWYRDNRDVDGDDGRGRRKLLPLPVDTFLARLLEHVPPPGFQTVRAYGLYASSKRAAWAVAREHFGQEPEAEPEPFTWRDFCEQMGHTAAAVCPVCGAPLVVYGRFGAGRGPPPDAVPRLAGAA
jgi:hypothetical protein